MGLKHQAASARKWRAAIRQVNGHFPRHLPPLLFLTDPERVADPTSILPSLPVGSGVIYRHFGAKNRQSVAQSLKQGCKEHGLSLLIAADPKLAQQVGAHGVHWPERMLSQSRAWRRRFSIQTASAHAPHAIRVAENAGMDAVILSTVFPSRSKSAGCPIGSQRFRQLSSLHRVPIYALGGINPKTAERVASHGGLATISGILP